jgi:hypothetical protein
MEILAIVCSAAGHKKYNNFLQQKILNPNPHGLEAITELTASG